LKHTHGFLLIIILLISLLSLLPAATTPVLRVITINVWSGSDYKGTSSFGMWETPEVLEQRYQILLKQLQELNPNVVFLQEANPVDRYAKRLSRDLGMDEIHQVCLAGIKIGSWGIPAHFKEGNAILAKPELKLCKENDWKLSGSPGIYSDNLTMHFDETISALAGEVIVDSTKVYLVNAHLSAAPEYNPLLSESLAVMLSNGKITKQEYFFLIAKWKEGFKRRKTELTNLRKRLNQIPKNSPVMLGGDFNATFSSDEMTDFFKESGYWDIAVADTSAQFTWDALHNKNIAYSCREVDARGNRPDVWSRFNARAATYSRRIDYIMLNSRFTANDIEQNRIVFDTPVDSIYASDHYGFMADISIENAMKTDSRIISVKTRTIKTAALPIVMYDTDTGFGYGGKVFALLKTAKHNGSFDLTLFNSTKGERWYRAVFSIPDRDLRQGKMYPLAVDVIADYDKYIKFNYFGIGNKSQFKDKETYTKEPIDFNLLFSHPYTSNLVLQCGLHYKSTRIYNIKPDGLLASLDKERRPGRETIIAFLENLSFDTRDVYSNPSKGLLLQEEMELSSGDGFPAPEYTRWMFNAQYFKVLFYPRTVLAMRSQVQSVLGGDSLPIQDLLGLGGGTTLRGYPLDRFLDRTVVVTNAEMRFPIYKSLGGTVALDAGKVWSKPSMMDLQGWAMNPTFGLRYYLDAFVVRLDVGSGKETTGFYFNFGQAF